MTATDLRRPAVPEALVAALRSRTRRGVLAQRIDVDFELWNNKLSTHGVPGGPIGSTNGSSLTRADVFSAAADPRRLLWLSMAWDACNHRRLCEKRIQSIAELGESATEMLSFAATTARTDPVAAFRAFAPSGKPAIKYLGAAFFTKFLYFAAGTTAPAPRPQILDSRVARSLYEHGWTSLRSSGGWTAFTYDRYICLVARGPKRSAVSSAARSPRMKSNTGLFQPSD